MRLRFATGKQKELLTIFRTKNNFSVKQLSEFLNVKEQALKKWISENRTLPEEVFHKIIETEKQLESYSKRILEVLPENWGDRKGGKGRINKIKDIHHYCQKMRRIQDKKRLIKYKTYFPNKVFNQLLKERVDLHAVLAVCLLTDGSVVKDRICYYSTDNQLKEIVYNIMTRLSSYKVNIYTDKNNGNNLRVSDAELVKQLKKFSPTYKKLPTKKQTKEEYYKEVQPSISFLNNLDQNTFKWCVRFGFSADGCISLSQQGTAYLCLTSYHHVLPFEWQELLDQKGLTFNLTKGKDSWCGIEGIRTSKRDNLVRFRELYGFIPEVQITAKSKYYKGLPKNEVLQKAITL